MKRPGYFLIFLSIFIFLFAASAAAQQIHCPYILADTPDGSFLKNLAGVKTSVKEAGFEIVGEYHIEQNSAVLAITNEELRKVAAQSKYGAYGAAQRVALTKRNNQLQLSFTNPVYWGSAYKMGDLSGISTVLKNTLGFKKEFGSEDGLTNEDLREYHYMIAMPYFEDHNELATYTSFQEAVAAVEKGLASGKNGASKVYRIDMPGKDETVFGVAIKEGDGSDLTVIGNCDITETFHTAYAPYEILVSGKKIFSPHGRFRIALSFPDLSMGTFMQISGAPGDIEDVLTAVAQGK